MNGRRQPMTAWHSLGVSEVAEQLDASEGGLSEDAATARLAEFGPNMLPQKPPTPLWAIVLWQFRSPLIYIIALAADVSLAIGDVKDAARFSAAHGTPVERREHLAHALPSWMTRRSNEDRCRFEN